jgi:hypothetical protein
LNKLREEKRYIPVYQIQLSGITVQDSERTHIVSHAETLSFENENFFLEDRGNGEVYVATSLLCDHYIALPRRKYINFKTEYYDIDKPPKVPFRAIDNPDDGSTEVIFYAPHGTQDGPPGVIDVTGICPIDIQKDLNAPGRLKASLSIPLEVKYGGTGRTSLTRKALLIGREQNAVGCLDPGNLYTILNNRSKIVKTDVNGSVVEDFMEPEWTTWSIIEDTYQAGVLPKRPINLSRPYTFITKSGSSTSSDSFSTVLCLRWEEEDDNTKYLTLKNFFLTIVEKTIDELDEKDSVLIISPSLPSDRYKLVRLDDFGESFNKNKGILEPYYLFLTNAENSGLDIIESFDSIGMCQYHQNICLYAIRC